MKKRFLVRNKDINKCSLLTSVIIMVIGLWTLAGCSAAESSQSIEMTSQIDCPYPLKQLYMCDAYKGWAVSAENEVLYTDSGIEDFAPVKKLEHISSASDSFVNAAFPDAQTAYVAYLSEDNTHIIVDYTDDGGAVWNQTFVEYDELLGGRDAGSVYISFADAENGYLLYCSSPAAGLMGKLLFRTTDSGKSFSFVSDLTNELAGGYPQGVAFNSKDNGYIAVTYHGEYHYLYGTEDGARTWKSISPLLKDKDTSYIDGYVPVFYGEDMQAGILVLKTVGEKASYKLLTTADGGHNWKQEGELPFEAVKGCSAVEENKLLVIDGGGNVYELMFSAELKTSCK